MKLDAARSTGRVLAAALLAATATARADEPDEATVRADRQERERARVEGGTGFATSVDARARGRTAESVADVLDEVPGLHVRRTGDGLAPQSVSLRGAPAAHVTVALDGVVLNDAASDGVDLSLVPPALLDRVDVYRGAAPLRLGVGGLGGAVEVVTRALPPRASSWATAGYGSFGARRAGVFTGARAGPVRALVALGYRGTNGDYSFFDDGGTALDARDDRTNTRVNNRADALDLLYRACAGPERSAACLVALAGWRRRDVPGPGAFQPAGPFLDQRRVLVRVGVPLALARGAVETWAAVVARRDHFANRGAVLLPATAGPFDARATTWSLEAGAAPALRLGALAASGVARGRYERFVPDGDADASRASLLAGVELALRAGAVTLAPAAGVELLADDRGAARGTRGLASPRLGVAWAAAPWLALRVNAGHFRRAPTLPELYGDRGTIQGDPALRPEVANALDAGAVVTLRAGRVQLRVEAAGYHRRVRDLIALVQTSRATFRPYNLEAAAVTGVEAQARLAVGRALRVAVAYALTDARVDAPGDALVDGNRVPGVPTHDLHADVAAALGPVGLGARASYVSGAFINQANTAEIPGRWLVGASATLTAPFARWLTLGVEGANLLDARTASLPLRPPAGNVTHVTAPVQDFFGYPLPGRSVFVSLTAQTDGP